MTTKIHAPATFGHLPGDALIEREETRGRCCAELIELNSTEVRLVTDTGISFNEPIKLLIRGDRGDVTQLSATASWIRPVDSQRWLVRCRLAEELSVEEQSRLAGSLHLERRRYPRYPSDLAATVQRELSTDTFPARVLDVSVGGCRLQTQESADVGSRLVVRFQGEDRALLARVQWRSKVSQGYELGVEFISFLS